MTFTFLENCTCEKLLPLLFSVSLLLFCQLIFSLSLFVRAISFCKKNIHWLKIVLITLRQFLFFLFSLQKDYARTKSTKSTKITKRLNQVKAQNATSDQ